MGFFWWFRIAGRRRGSHRRRWFGKSLGCLTTKGMEICQWSLRYSELVLLTLNINPIFLNIDIKLVRLNMFPRKKTPQGLGSLRLSNFPSAGRPFISKGWSPFEMGQLVNRGSGSGLVGASDLLLFPRTRLFPTHDLGSAQPRVSNILLKSYKQKFFDFNWRFAAIDNSFKILIMLGKGITQCGFGCRSIYASANGRSIISQLSSRNVVAPVAISPLRQIRYLNLFKPFNCLLTKPGVSKLSASPLPPDTKY